MPELATSVNTVLIGGGLLLIFLELVGGIQMMLDLVLAGFAMLIGGTVGFVFFSWWLGPAIAAGIILSYWVLLRRALRLRYFHTVSNSNMDRIKDEVGKVVRRSGNRWVAKFDGEDWTCESDVELEIGQDVRIEEFRGAILKIKPLNS
jgi:membrane protein implicated in regulation of membrane protease activity